MKALIAIALAAACTSSPAADKTYRFGPFSLAPGEEQTDTCVSITLGNTEPIYVNSVEMVGATGIHHSNWFWVPDNTAFPAPDGVWSCSQYHFDTAAAALFGGVLFAQSTQATRETQAFPPGAAIKIMPHAKILGNLHLLNAGDTTLSVPLSLTLHAVADKDVTAQLAGFAMENQAIALPPHATSRFAVECDFTEQWQTLYSQGLVASPAPDFKIYHALPHYHALGAGLTFEAVRDDGSGVDTIWTTDGRVGDTLGGTLAPPFDITGHAKLRFSCTYDNPRDVSVGWGNGDQEMCIVFAFTDSTYTWDAGVLSAGDPGPMVLDGSVMTYTAPACKVVAADATH